MFRNRAHADAQMGTPTPTDRLQNGVVRDSARVNLNDRVYEGSLAIQSMRNRNTALSSAAVRYVFTRNVDKCNRMNGNNLIENIDDGAPDMAWRRSEMTNSRMQQALVKFSEYTFSYELADFSGLAYYIACHLSWDSYHGEISLAHLSRNVVPRVTLLKQAEYADVRLMNSVYLPGALVERDACAFMVLVYACAGLNVEVKTDQAGAAILRNPARYSTERIRHGAWRALQMLSHNAEIDKAGVVIDFAIFCGFNFCTTLCGHTHEGAWLRNLVRAVRFRRPSGMVVAPNAGDQVVTHWMIPVGGERSTSAMMVDSVIAVGAATFSLVDPGIKINGAYHATVMYAAGDNEEVWQREHAADLPTLVASIAEAWSAAFFQCCGGIACEVSVAALLIDAAGRADLANDHHLKYKTIAPLYWVEPTTIVTKSCHGGVKEGAPGAPLAYVGDNGTEVRLSCSVERFGASTVATFKDRGARYNPWIVSCLVHPQDGLGSAVFVDVSVNQIACAGVENVEAAVVARRPVGDFLWTHGDCQIPAPSELNFCDHDYTVSVALIDALGAGRSCLLPGDEKGEWWYSAVSPRRVDGGHRCALISHRWDPAPVQRMKMLALMYEPYVDLYAPSVRIRRGVLPVNDTPVEVYEDVPPIEVPEEVPVAAPVPVIRGDRGPLVDGEIVVAEHDAEPNPVADVPGGASGQPPEAPAARL